MIIDGVEYIKKSEIEEKKNLIFLPNSIETCAIVTIKEENDKLITSKITFEKNNSEIKLLLEIPNQDYSSDDLFVYKKGIKFVNISKEYYDLACQTLKFFSEYKPELFVQNEKNKPVLIKSGEYGVVIAPRITNE